MASRNQFGQFKSKIIHFRKRNIKEVHLHCVGNTSLEYVAAYNYLGVLFKKKKDFKSNGKNVSRSGRASFRIVNIKNS